MSRCNEQALRQHIPFESCFRKPCRRGKRQSSTRSTLSVLCSGPAGRIPPLPRRETKKTCVAAWPPASLVAPSWRDPPRAQVLHSGWPALGLAALLEQEPPPTASSAHADFCKASAAHRWRCASLKFMGIALAPSDSAVCQSLPSRFAAFRPGVACFVDTEARCGSRGGRLLPGAGPAHSGSGSGTSQGAVASVGERQRRSRWAKTGVEVGRVSAGRLRQHSAHRFASGVRHIRGCPRYACGVVVATSGSMPSSPWHVTK